MRILVTGRGGAASWTIRGEQIGAAIGATVKPNASLADMKAADVILAVKRVPEQMLADLQRCGRPWAYDIVDAYPQREAVFWTPQASIAWLRAYIGRLRPTTVIWPNEKMQRDAGIPGDVVYHHHLPGIAANPVRKEIGAIGYEGSPRYLNGIQGAIEAVCRARGARFVINPARLADVDVILALRAPNWRSYATREWKSNVKLANAHASGTPFVGTNEAGYRETAVGCEYWAESPRQVSVALDWLQAQEVRQVVAEKFREAAFPLERAAEQVKRVLCALKS